MTIIKQKSVTTKSHAQNLRNYINDPKALLRSFQNIRTPARWSFEMARTREMFGHNKPARSGSKNTIEYHQILAFLPDECDMNGGKMTPELCMKYAQEYARKRYPNAQIAFALHKEHCRADKTYRYAVHMAVNRSDLSTGNRLDEGLSRTAKRDRAEFVRGMDEHWELKQVEKGKQNSKMHARQPDRIGAEKKIIDRAEKHGIAPEDASYKYNLRELCRGMKKRAASMDEYRKLLADWGVETEIKDGKLYATDTDNNTYSFRVSRLDKALEENLLEQAFARNAENAGMTRIEAEIQTAAQELADHAAQRENYLRKVAECYQDYRKHAEEQKGSALEDIPPLLLPRIPESLSHDAEVRRKVLTVIRQGDAVRKQFASGTPLTNGQKSQPPQQNTVRQKPSQERTAPPNRDVR